MQDTLYHMLNVERPDMAAQIAAQVPKAELHCHIEGAAGPALAMLQAEKYGVDITPILRGGAYHWTNFTEFLHVYDTVASLFRTAEDYSLLAQHYLASLAAQNCLYCEFFISTDHAIGVGISPEDYIAGLADGMEKALSAHGIVSRMIATGLRHGGPDAVLRAARFAADNPHPLITGFGMAGDERMHAVGDFVPAFNVARDAGLRITVHAGELVGAQSVRDALDYLSPERIGHGVRAIEDKALVERLAKEGIVLECCPRSNIALKVFDDFASHPFNALFEAGVKVTLNSDDPPHFHTSLGHEYEIAETHFGLGEAALVAVTRTALESAFVDETTKSALLAKLPL